MLLECRVLAFPSPGTDGDAIVDTPNVGINVNLCQTDGDAWVDLEATPHEIIQPTAVQGGLGRVGGRNSLAPESRRLIREVIFSLSLSFSFSLSLSLSLSISLSLPLPLSLSIYLSLYLYLSICLTRTHHTHSEKREQNCVLDVTHARKRSRASILNPSTHAHTHVFTR
jgi:hypothetical protein